MFCAISGQVPQEPVYVAQTGLVYERSLLLKALETSSGRCPVTDTTLSKDDVLVVKSSGMVLPRPPSSNSFPSLLSSLQSEWDSLLLEQVVLRRQLTETRQELAASLYEREAATVVIGKLLLENKSLKTQLENGAQVPIAFQVAVEKTASELQAHRKSHFKVQNNYYVGHVEKVRLWKRGKKMTPHSTKKPGATCLSMETMDIRNIAQEDRRLVAGGADGNLKVLDPSKEQIEATLSKHTGSIADVSLNKDVVVACGKDKRVTVWSTSSWDCVHDLSHHSSAVTSCPLHPGSSLFGSTDVDGSWALSDLANGQVVLSSSGTSIQTSRFHPDGSLYALACADSIKVFNITADPSKGPVTDPLSHGSEIRALAFSQNGYILASAGVDGLVKLWDLRKLDVIATIKTSREKSSATSVAFDEAGSFIAVGDSLGGIAITVKPEKIKANVEWDIVTTFHDNKKPITGLVFGANAGCLWASSMDRSVACFE